MPYIKNIHRHIWGYMCIYVPHMQSLASAMRPGVLYTVNIMTIPTMPMLPQMLLTVTHSSCTYCICLIGQISQKVNFYDNEVMHQINESIINLLFITMTSKWNWWALGEPSYYGDITASQEQEWSSDVKVINSYHVNRQSDRQKWLRRLPASAKSGR